MTTLTTPLAPQVAVRDLAGNSIVATSLQVLDWELRRVMSKATAYRIELPLGDPATLAIITANGGPLGTGPALPYLCEFSLSAGSAIDCRFLADSAEMTITNTTTSSLILSGDDIFDLYTRTGVDRVTFYGVSPQNMLNGPAGTIPVDSTDLLLQGIFLPYQKGIFQTKPGRSQWVGRPYLVMTPIADFALSGLRLQMDLWASKTSEALDAIMTAVGGYYLPGDYAPIGTRQYWFADSSDGSVQIDTIGTYVLCNICGIRNGIACGWVGNTPYLAFTNQSSTPVVDETTTAIVLDPIVADPNTQEMAAQAEFVGGASDHGLPAGGSITAITTIRYGHAPTAINWDASMLVIGVSTAGGGGGGVFFYPQSGGFYPMSQAMDVNDLQYDPVAGKLYAATQGGVFTHSDNPTDPAPWQLVGGLQLPVSKLLVPMPALTEGVSSPGAGSTDLYIYVVDANGNASPVDPVGVADQFDVQRVYVPGGAYAQTIIALVTGSGSGADGIYTNSSATASAALGHSGWTQLVASSSIIDVGASVGRIYYADTNNPTYLQTVTLGGSPGTAVRVPPVQGGYPAITGIDSQPDSGYTYIRTSAGALGLFVLTPGSVAFANANADGTLVDSDGNPVLVNRVAENRPKSSMNGAKVPLFAVTDSGLYQSPSFLGGNWTTVSGQSAIDTTSVRLFTTGATQTVLGRQLVRLYVGASNNLYQSNSGGIWWLDLLSMGLDLGPFWEALAIQCGAAPYPDAQLSNLGDPTNTLGYTPDWTGNTIPIPATNPRLLPPGFLWSRRLNEHNDFSYRLVNFGSSDPHFGVEFAELSELSTSELMGAITASERLALASYRWLAASSTPQLRLTLMSSFWTQEAALRRLRPMHQVQCSVLEQFTGTDGTLRTVLNLNRTMQVLEHTVRRGSTTGSDAESETIVSTVQHAQPLPPDELAQALSQSLSKLKRYGTNRRGRKGL